MHLRRFPFHSPVAVRGLDAVRSVPDRGGIGQGGDQTDDADNDQKSSWHHGFLEGGLGPALVLDVEPPRTSSVLGSTARPAPARFQLEPSLQPLSRPAGTTARGRIARRSADRLIRVARHLRTQLLTIALPFGLPLTVGCSRGCGTVLALLVQKASFLARK